MLLQWSTPNKVHIILNPRLVLTVIFGKMTEQNYLTCSEGGHLSKDADASHKLELMMVDRIKAIDNIRTLLEHELEQDNGLMAESTDRSWRWSATSSPRDGALRP